MPTDRSALGTSTPSTQGNGTTSAAATLRSIDTTLSTQPAQTTKHNGNPGTTHNPPTDPTKLDAGAKAGIAVGIISAVLIIAFAITWLRRRSKKTKAKGEFRVELGPSDEKQVVIPDASEISKKPELDSEPAARYDLGHAYQNGYSAQSQQESNPSELYSSNEYSTELQGMKLVELHSSSRSKNREPDGILSVYPSVRTPQRSLAPPPT